jgi:hypothetical protein
MRMIMVGKEVPSGTTQIFLLLLSTSQSETQAAKGTVFEIFLFNFL